MNDESDGFDESWQVSDQVAYWDGCRQTLEEADNRVQQYVSSVLTYIPALAGAGLTVLAVSTASSYFLGYVAGVLIGLAGLGMTFEAKSQADPTFGTLAGAIGVMERVEARMRLPEDMRMSTEIGKVMAKFSNRSRPEALKKRFDALCYAMLAAFALVTALGLVGIYLHY